MNEEVIETLKAWKPDGARGEDFVFVTPKGQPILDPKKAFNALVRAAKVTDFTWHDLRHAFASKLAMRGVDLLTIKETTRSRLRQDDRGLCSLATGPASSRCGAVVIDGLAQTTDIRCMLLLNDTLLLKSRRGRKSRRLAPASAA